MYDEERVRLVIGREDDIRDISSKIENINKEMKGLMVLKDSLDPNVVDGFLEMMKSNLMDISVIIENIIRNDVNYIRRRKKKTLPYYSDSIYNEFIRSDRMPLKECK